MGGLQTIGKYKKIWFKKGMLGNFILPFFVFSWVIGLFGLFVFAYRIIRTIILEFLSTSYSIQTQTAIFRFSDINLTPNVLVFFGITVFVFSLWFTVIALLNMGEVGFYMLFYLIAYPIILIISGYKFLRGYRKW